MILVADTQMRRSSTRCNKHRCNWRHTLRYVIPRTFNQ